MTVGIQGYKWVMATTVNEEVWAWKDITSQKTYGAYSIGSFFGCVERNEYENF